MKRMGEILPTVHVAEKQYDMVLTLQEKRILSLMEEGATNKEIAEKLGLMLSTVKTYNYELYQKLSVKNRTQAIMAAKDAGVI